MQNFLYYFKDNSSKQTKTKKKKKPYAHTETTITKWEAVFTQKYQLRYEERNINTHFSSFGCEISNDTNGLFLPGVTESIHPIYTYKVLIKVLTFYLKTSECISETKEFEK